MDLVLRPRPEQKLAMTLGLKQALQVLQMPVMELAEWIKIQIEHNPLLEYQEVRKACPESETVQEIDFDKRNFSVLDELDELFRGAVFPEERAKKSDPSLPYCTSLFDHLMHQAKEVFSSQDDLQKAEQIIGSLDERGFLGEGSFDSNILSTIQTFDPPGVAARDLRDSLLIQLRLLGKEETPAYRAIRDHLDAPAELKKFQRELLNLNFYPARRFHHTPTPFLIPDVIVERRGEGWHIEINEEPLPLFRLSSISSSNASDQTYIRHHLAEGKWLLRILRRRHLTLKSIVLYLLKKQEPFFQGQLQKLHPLTLHEVSQDLGLHESTVARAVGSKVVACPHGVFSLRTFFSSGLSTMSGKKISSRTVKTLIAEMIAREDKAAPLSDGAIASQLSKQGIYIARRTIAKYRHQLRLGPTLERKLASISVTVN
jgi:RNA polymerase sigma-54 factor